jgi:hypothetical protein
MTTPSLAHFMWLCTPSRGQHQRPGKAGSAVFPDWPVRAFCLLPL